MSSSADEAALPRTFILILSCPQRPGIVHAVTAFLFGHGCDIVEHQQFDDPIRGALFLRTEFVAVGDAHVDAEQLSSAFKTEVAEEFGMNFELSDNRPERALVMVSRMGHCLNDLIFRWRAGSLNADLVAVVSNHEDLRPMAEAAGLPYFHVPVTPESKARAEQRLLEIVDQYQANLGYSPATCRCYRTICASNSLSEPSTSTTRSCPDSRGPTLSPGLRPRRQAHRGDGPLRNTRSR